MAIIIETIRLTELELKVIPENTRNLNFEISLACHSSFPEPNRLIQTTYFDLARDLENPPFIFKFTFVGEFRSDGQGEPTIEVFAEVHAPAYVVPYARELVANLTSRLVIIPPLVLPPINVFQLVQDAKRKTEQEPS